MTTTHFSEDKCFNVIWKIKNFTFFRKTVESPDFYFFENVHNITISNWLGGFLQFELNCRVHNGPRICGIPMQFSILTCDGSAEEFKESSTSFKFVFPKKLIFGCRRNSFLPEDILTIRWRFSTSSESGKLFMYSNIGIKRDYFWWTIKNFSKFELYETKFSKLYVKIPGDEFTYNDNIALTLKPTGASEALHFSIEICHSPNRKYYCILNMYVIDAKGNAINCLREDFLFDSKVKVKNFPLNLKKLKLDAFKTLFLPNDTLSLRCYFAISEGKVTDETSCYSFRKDGITSRNFYEYVSSLANESNEFLRVFEGQIDPDNSTELQSSLRSILDDGTYSDVRLQIGTEVIQAHKSILSARSPVFCAMFSKEMQETICNSVVIEDLSGDTVLKFLQYVYTDIVHDYTWETLKKLYYAADKYQVLSLKMKCVKRMETNLSLSNVCEALVFADLHQDSRLKISVLDFISEYDAVIFDSEAWKEIEKNNPSLANQVLREICSIKRMRLN